MLACSPSCYSKLLDKLQKQIYRTVGPLLEPLAHCQNVASLSLFIGITLRDIHLNWLNWFLFLFLERSLLVRSHDFSVTILRSYKNAMSTVSFVAQLDSGILCL